MHKIAMSENCGSRGLRSHARREIFEGPRKRALLPPVQYRAQTMSLGRLGGRASGTRRRIGCLMDSMGSALIESPTLRAVADGKSTAAELWQQLQRDGAPVIEDLVGDSDHRLVTFVLRGSSATR